MIDQFKKFGLYIVAVIFFILYFGFGIWSTSIWPNNVLFFVDQKTQTYIAPPCLMEREFDNVTSIQKYATTNNLVVVRSEEISSKELNPDRDCRAQNGFIGDGRSLSGKFLEKIGLLPKFKSRWNSDGTWNK